MTVFETTDPGSHAGPDAGGDVLAEGWYDDPFELHRMRYHSGVAWTDNVTHYGPTPCVSCGSTDT